MNSEDLRVFTSGEFMATKKGKILIVDDNAGIRQALKILLPMYFQEVEAIPSPSTLVTTLERFGPFHLDFGPLGGLSARCFTIHLSDWCVGFVG